LGQEDDMRPTAAAVMGFILSTGAAGSLLGHEASPRLVTPALHSLAMALNPADEESAIRRAFKGALDREPSARELRRYHVLMEQEGWTEADVRRDLRERSDYQKNSTQRSGRPEGIVRRAYQDILGRDPDPEGLRVYRSKIVDEGWTEQDVREALRRSDEYASTDRRTASADRIIRRAYQDILRREPDADGLQAYRRAILEDGWEEHDIREALRRSAEKKQQRTGSSNAGVEKMQQKAGMSDGQAVEIVRRAYLSVLNREPDVAGLNEYKNRVLRDRWSEQQVIAALRNSDEYRSKNR
jgi:TorA maturation chaperone TorD